MGRRQLLHHLLIQWSSQCLAANITALSSIPNLAQQSTPISSLTINPQMRSELSTSFSHPTIPTAVGFEAAAGAYPQPSHPFFDRRKRRASSTEAVTTICSTAQQHTPKQPPRWDAEAIIARSCHRPPVWLQRLQRPAYQEPSFHRLPKSCSGSILVHRGNLVCSTSAVFLHCPQLPPLGELYWICPCLISQRATKTYLWNRQLLG